MKGVDSVLPFSLPLQLVRSLPASAWLGPDAVTPTCGSAAGISGRRLASEESGTGYGSRLSVAGSEKQGKENP